MIAQHFLQRTTFNVLSIQNILSKVNTENEENVLKETKESYEILINSVEGKGSEMYFMEKIDTKEEIDHIQKQGSEEEMKKV